MIAQFFKIFVLLFLLASLSACSQNSNHKADEFYTEHGEWDSARIPFIKPYESVIVNDKNGWVMNLVALKGGDSMLSSIRKATVINGFILVHTGSTSMMGIDIKESWWVISSSRKIEKGFIDHHQYLAYLRTIGFEKEPKLHDMKVIASYYEDHDTMNWNDWIKKELFSQGISADVPDE